MELLLDRLSCWVHSEDIEWSATDPTAGENMPEQIPVNSRKYIATSTVLLVPFGTIVVYPFYPEARELDRAQYWRIMQQALANHVF